MRIVRAMVKNIEEGVEVIKRGGTVIYPTDTVYGIGCNPFDKKAVKKIIKIKDRLSPLPILASSMEYAQRAASFTENSLRMTRLFWPGGLTLVLPHQIKLPDEVTRGGRTIGIRIPNHEFTRRFLEASGGILVGTSANKRGLPPPTSVEEAVRGIGEEADLIFDGGETPLKKPSTVVEIVDDEVKIIREGAIPRDSILGAMER